MMAEFLFESRTEIKWSIMKSSHIDQFLIYNVSHHLKHTAYSKNCWLIRTNYMLCMQIILRFLSVFVSFILCRIFTILILSGPGLESNNNIQKPTFSHNSKQGSGDVACVDRWKLNFFGF